MSDAAVAFEDSLGLFTVYEDGSVRRASPSSLFDVPVIDGGSVQWKDYTFDPQNNLSLRLYKPTSPNNNNNNSNKLPVIYNFHGGGFCIGSRADPISHNCCCRLASRLQAVVVSPDYRLAPESRLPAAVEDGYAALKWLQDEGDGWLGDVADFGNVFVCGESAGGNIAHNLAVRLGSGSPELAPVEVKGYVLLAPFFGGTVRTRSEAEAPKDVMLNLELVDWFWRLSVPVGDTTDHPLINPFGPSSKDLEPVALDPVLVVVGGSDLLKDRAKVYAEKLTEMGKKIEYVEFEGQQHGFFTIDPEAEPAKKLMGVIKRFIAENSS
ncbi:unnamed protein product [Linum tenue]|uniref:Alpha/beta hydrolase fold-3 domain-containing protein n=1 Tax=Linum tenue TaxID=586396 RepID=A0AAV0QHZ7_9ROSI|nr:unnamed protein product [Linum tenue]